MTGSSFHQIAHQPLFRSSRHYPIPQQGHLLSQSAAVRGGPRRDQKRVRSGGVDFLQTHGWPSPLSSSGSGAQASEQEQASKGTGTTICSSYFGFQSSARTQARPSIGANPRHVPWIWGADGTPLSTSELHWSRPTTSQLVSKSVNPLRIWAAPGVEH